MSSFEEKELLVSLNVFLSPILAPLSFSLHLILRERDQVKEHKSVMEEGFIVV